MKSTIKQLITALLMIVSMAAMADDSVSMIVTNDGETLKVYNIDYSSAEWCYYTLSPDSDDMKRIKKSDVLIVKLADGTKVDLTAPVASATPANGSGAISATKTVKKNPGEHPAVTHKAVTKPVGSEPFAVTDGANQQLTMKVLSEADKTLEVTKPGKKMAYDLEEYVIPDYVDIEGVIYTVTRIGDKAFKNIGFWVNDKNIKRIVLPGTLKEIGTNAFAGREGLRNIIIPDSVEKIGAEAFAFCGRSCPTFEQLYIPETVKTIGQNAFREVSSNTSYRGFFQGNLSCIPSFITTGNCKDYGIDEEAVEAYEKRKR